MVVGIRRQITTVVGDRRRRMSGFQFHGAGRSIDGRDQNEHGDEQRKERRDDAVPVLRPDHAVV